MYITCTSQVLFSRLNTIANVKGSAAFITSPTVLFFFFFQSSSSQSTLRTTHPRVSHAFLLPLSILVEGWPSLREIDEFIPSASWLKPWTDWWLLQDWLFIKMGKQPFPQAMLPVCGSREHSEVSWRLRFSTLCLSLWWNHFVVWQIRMRAHTPT